MTVLYLLSLLLILTVPHNTGNCCNLAVSKVKSLTNRMIVPTYYCSSDTLSLYVSNAQFILHDYL